MLQKITQHEVNQKNVKSAPDNPTGSAVDIKNLFDKLTELIVSRFNLAIDELMSSAGAENIGNMQDGLSGSKLSEQIASIVTLLNDRYTKAESNALATQETKNLVANVDVNLSNGVITVTKKDGTSKQYDTALEKVPAKFEFVQEDGAYKIKVTNVDGSISKTDVTALMNLYSFADTSDIDFSVSGSGVEKTVTATVKAGSIGIDKLSLSAVSAIEGYVSSAATSAQSAEYAKNEAVTAKNEAVDAREQAETYKVEAVNAASLAGQSKTEAKESEKLSKSYAIGGTGARPDEATDNAKHYSEVARVEADRAKREADEAAEAKTGAVTSANTARAKAEQAVSAGNAAESAQSEAQRLANVAQSEAQKAESAKSAAETAKNKSQELKTQTEQLKTRTEELKTQAEASANMASVKAAEAKNEADRAKREADRASSIVGGDFATKVEVANAVQVETDNRTQAINAETAARTQAIQAEANARNQADNQLQQNIAAESETRENADSQLQTQIQSEKQIRQNADNILQQNINNETAARQEADGKLIATSEGVHGLRYYNEKLQKKNDNSWEDIFMGNDSFSPSNTTIASDGAITETSGNRKVVTTFPSSTQIIQKLYISNTLKKTKTITFSNDGNTISEVIS